MKKIAVATSRRPRLYEEALPAHVQEALGELVGAAREGLLALSVGVGLGVLAELMEEEVVRWLVRRVGTTRIGSPCATATRRAR